ncbi:MAG: DNA polymerase III subunit gamma/tau [Muribaculaceae bacterium]
MENYIVSARKYRPSTFKTIVGQQGLTHTLKSAIDSEKLAHAYLFCGPRGVGKTSCARIFAKTINCLNPTADGEACNECESCVAFNEQRSYNIVELDAASNNSVDNMRNLTEQVRVPPPLGKYRVFIIDEVHMLSTQAFNAFLKTLEEPPSHAIFILATTEKHKIIPTILSRCQIYDFARITPQDIVEQLTYIASQEKISVEPAALNVIALKADGAMRDALSIFDQVAASTMGNITYRSAIDNLNVLDYDYYFRLVEVFLSGDVPESLLIYKEVRDRGFDSLFFINGVASHLRNLMVAQSETTISLLEVSNDVAQRYIEQSRKCAPSFFYKAMDICNTCDMNYRTASNKQFLIELSLIKLCQLTDTPLPPQPHDTIKKVVAVQENAVQPAKSEPLVAPSPSVPVVTERKVEYNAVPAPTPTPTHKVIPAVTPRIMVNGGAANDRKTQIEVTPKAVKSNNSEFSEEQMKEAWMSFIAENSKLVLLTNAMRGATPQKSSNDKFEVQVDNVGQLEIMNTHLLDVVNYLRNKLSNENITLTASVSVGNVAPKILNPADIVAEMMTKNKAIKDLIETFQLGLS